MRKLGAATKRVLLEGLGWLLVAAGIAAIFLPGPGLLMLFAGVVVLSQQYEWAERRVEPLKQRALKAASDSVETWTRIVASSGVALVLIGFGALWIWDPPAPGWWPMSDGWWLVGGWATGLTQVLSGLIALGTIAYSYRRFRSPSRA
ncbi:PGPGW domain-containing protein [Nocardioides sp. GCM10027113]|uniref:PGPGW domain-containing protein n=1 Tax=unclassified Nocardioides TaxID=2615069 RepID=UPI003612614A